jgi:hypothetical protein
VVDDATLGGVEDRHVHLGTAVTDQPVPAHGFI